MTFIIPPNRFIYLHRAIGLQRIGKGPACKLLCGISSQLFFAAAVFAATPSSEDILRSVGVPQQQIEKLDRGEIISRDIPEASGKELAMGIALYLEVPLENIADYFKYGDLIAIDPDITAHGEIGKNAGVADFNGLRFSEEQSDEAVDFLNAEAGDQFNLSNREITELASIKSQVSGADKKTLAELASRKYREILLQRFQAYRTNGLAGIAAYSREDGTAEPAVELQVAAANNKVLSQFFPDLFQGWVKYPESLPDGIEQHFNWMNRGIENRPTAILGHRILQITKTGAIIIARQYYVGHSYNSSQLMVGALPYRQGTLVFYGQRVSTDRVAGIASSLRHSIGREQMKEQMIDRLKKLGRTLKTVSTAH